MAKAANKATAGGVARLVAHLVKAFREREGLTQKELGDMVGYSAAAISALETGAQPASDEMLVALEAVIGDGMGIFELARELVQRDKFPEHFQDFFPLEQEAATLFLFATDAIYGIFQTEAYAHALIAGGFPVLADERVEELVEGRMARKALFDRDPVPLIELILDEGVLRRGIGTPEVMRGQCQYLAELARLRHVTVYVLPFSTGLLGEHAGARGGMNIVETPRYERLVYIETGDESMLISDGAKVSTYSQRYAKIRAQALGPRESLGLIERVAGEWQ